MIESPKFSFITFTPLGEDKDPACSDSLETLSVISASDLAFQLHLILSVAITSVKLELSIQSHSGVNLFKKSFGSCLQYTNDDSNAYVFFVTLNDVDISEIIPEGECFRFLAEITTNSSTFSARSNLFRFSPTCEHTTLIEYRCDESYALGFYYCSNLYNRIRIPARLSKPQPKEESNIYVKHNGQRKVLSASISKEYELDTEWMSEEFHDRLAIALSHDSVLLDGKLLTKSTSYDIGWEEVIHSTAPAKCKMVENVMYRNINCGSSSGCSDFSGVTDPTNPTDPVNPIVFEEKFNSWSGGLPSNWTRLADKGAVLTEIPGGGITFSGVTGADFDVIGRLVSIPSGYYSVTIELFEALIDDPFDNLRLSISSLTQPDTKIVKIPAGVLSHSFAYTGSVKQIKLKFLDGHTKTFVAKVKSITIKTV